VVTVRSRNIARNDRYLTLIVRIRLAGSFLVGKPKRVHVRVHSYCRRPITVEFAVIIWFFRLFFLPLKHAEKILGAGVPLLRRLVAPENRLRLVLRDSLA